jgi:hypothetical protein
MPGRCVLVAVTVVGVVSVPGTLAASERTHTAIQGGGRAAVAKGPGRVGKERSRQRRVLSPCGRHVFEVSRGAVFVNARRIHPAEGTVQLLTPPVWRADGRAVAWIERGGRGEIRLIVVHAIGASAEALPWPLPVAARGDRVFWADANRVVVGPKLLAPRAVASWEEPVIQ